MILSQEEQAMAGGERGPGIQKCMDILIRFGEAFDAEKMVRITSAHTMPKEPLQLLNEMTEGVSNTGAITTLHAAMAAFSPKSWRKMGLPEEFGTKEAELFDQRAAIYRRCGFLQTYTCLPMLVGNLPRKGDYVSWIGTGAQIIVNSLFGARCNRDGTVVNLAAAVTGRVPCQGMLLDENRFAEVIVKLENLDPEALSNTELGAIGYHVGAKAGSRNVVIDGLPPQLELERLKYLMAPMAVSGSVCMCHVAGMTPEAPDLETALGGRKPKEILTIGPKQIRENLEQYTDDGQAVDMVIFGCPHCTVPEIKALAGLLDQKKISASKRLWIGMPYQHYYLAQTMGYTATVEAAGGVFASSCMATIPEAPVPDGVGVIATNSFKAAHYISRLTKGKVKLVVKDMDRCVDAITKTG